MTGPILSAQMRLSEVSDWLSRLPRETWDRMGIAVDSWSDSAAFASLHLHFTTRSHAMLFARDHLAYAKEHHESEHIGGQSLYMVELPSFRVTLFYPTP